MTNKTPIPMFRQESEASRLLRYGDPIGAPIIVTEVQPSEQPHISLGNFKANQPPKGFAFVVIPEDMKDVVSSQLTRLGAEYDQYELVLHIANNGDKTVIVEVSQL